MSTPAAPQHPGAALVAVADRAAPGVLAVLVALLSVAGYPDWPARPEVVLVAALSGLATLVMRSRPAAVAVVGSVGWLWVGMWPAVLVAGYVAGVRLRGRRLLAVAGVSVVVVGTLAWLVPVPGPREVAGPGNALVAVGGLVLLPVVVGMWVAARRDVLEGVRAQGRARAAEQSAAVARERAEERARIAREMHDVVAHRVSLMVLQAGALEVRTGDPAAAATAGLIRELGREALTDLREVLGVLRVPGDQLDTVLAPPPGLGDLDRLLDQSRAAGLPVTRRDAGPVGPVPAAVQTAAYRVVQEALTNVHRHAGRADTVVELAADGDVLVVRVDNAAPDTPPPPERLPGSGRGLVGLRERVTVLGGSFAVGSRPDGGFTVRAELPLDAVAATP